MKRCTPVLGIGFGAVNGVKGKKRVGDTVRRCAVRRMSDITIPELLLARV